MHVHDWTQALRSLSYYFNTLSEFCWQTVPSGSSALHEFVICSGHQRMYFEIIDKCFLLSISSL